MEGHQGHRRSVSSTAWKDPVIPGAFLVTNLPHQFEETATGCLLFFFRKDPDGSGSMKVRIEEIVRSNVKGRIVSACLCASTFQPFPVIEEGFDCEADLIEIIHPGVIESEFTNRHPCTGSFKSFKTFTGGSFWLG